jgi:hypothetical protein
LSLIKVTDVLGFFNEFNKIFLGVSAIQIFGGFGTLRTDIEGFDVVKFYVNFLDLN